MIWVQYMEGRVVVLALAEITDEKHRKNLERLMQFRLMDDVFFTKFFEDDPESVQLILRIITGIDDLTVLEVRTQVFMENMFSRSLRLDIVATDNQGRIYNIEIQRDSRGAGKKRARFHSSLLDVNLLDKGGNFDDLPEVYVIFITEEDVLGMGKAVYHIGRCLLDTDERFDDGSHMIYVNGACRDGSPIGLLMHDFFCTDADEMHYSVLADRMRYFKGTGKGADNMTLLSDELREEGRAEERKTTALFLLQAGKYALEEIAAISRLPIEEIRKLQAAQGC